MNYFFSGTSAQSNEGTSLSLTCLTNQFISILLANYGKYKWILIADFILMCLPILYFLSSNEASCSVDVTSRLNDACFGQNSYSFTPKNEYFGQDPCPGIGKYVTVQYECLQQITTTGRI